MKHFILRMSSSLSARIIFLVVISQLSILILTALVQANARAKFYSNYTTQNFGYDEASVLYDYLFVDVDNNSFPQNSEIRADRIILWEDILQKNPNFRYIRERDGKVLTSGPLPLGYEDEKKRFASYETDGANCVSSNQRRTDSYVNLLKCPGRPLSGTGLSGLEPNFVPINDSYIYGAETIFVPNSILWSYGLILLLSPLLVFFLIRPLRKAAKTAQQISPSSRGLQISRKGIFSEARGFVNAINDALRRLDLGYQREIEFRNAIAHELKTPLTILRARIDRVEAPDLRSQLIKDVTKMSRLIDQLLDFAKNSGEDKPLDKIDLGQVVFEACEHCRDAAFANGHNIDYQPILDTIFVRANPTAVFLAVTNLLDNAIQHSQSEEPVRVRVKKEGIIVIEDGGIGFKMEPKRDGLDSFEVFTLQATSGHGLGLNIARQAIALSQGTLSCESSEGKGTRYIISFSCV